MFRPLQRSSSVTKLNASSAPGTRNRSSSLSRLSQNSFTQRSSFVEQDKRTKDTRPLAERSYQNKCIFKLVKFLHENNYEHTINQKMLTSPFSKDIFRIFECIYRSFNPGYKISKKPEEEILQLMKILQYPFTMTKSTLQNAGSSRSWAAVLGMLMWLMEVSQYHNAVSPDFSPDAGAFGAITITHDILGKSFAQFLESGLDADEEEESKRFEKIAGLDEAKEKLSMAEETYEQLDKQLSDLEVQESHLHEMEIRKRTICADVQIVKDYISDIKERTDMKTEDHAKMMSEFQKQGTLLNYQQKEIDHLRGICQEQNEKGENMHQVQNRRQEMCEKLGREEQQLAQLKHQKLALENQLSRQKSKVDDLCRTFNNSCSVLKTLVPSEMHPLDVFEARFPGCSKEELERINHHLLSLSKKLKKDTVSTENKLIKQEEYLQELQLQLNLSIQELNDKNIQMEEQKRLSEDCLAKSKAELDQVEADLEANIQSINKLHEVLAMTPEQRQVHINKLQQQLEELTEAKNKVSDKMIKKITREGQKAKDVVAALEREETEFLEFLLEYLRRSEEN